MKSGSQAAIVHVAESPLGPLFFCLPRPPGDLTGDGGSRDRAWLWGEGRRPPEGRRGGHVGRGRGEGRRQSSGLVASAPLVRLELLSLSVRWDRAGVASQAKKTVMVVMTRMTVTVTADAYRERPHVPCAQGTLPSPPVISIMTVSLPSCLALVCTPCLECLPHVTELHLHVGREQLGP